MFPLGECWAGLCHADPASPVAPQDLSHCNFGYARGECVRFPDAPGPDAVRFTVTRDDSAGVHIYYVMERDHHPFAHGALAYAYGSGFEPPPGGLLEGQAVAYVQSFRRRKGA